MTPHPLIRAICQQCGHEYYRIESEICDLCRAAYKNQKAAARFRRNHGKPERTRAEIEAETIGTTVAIKLERREGQCELCGHAEMLTRTQRTGGKFLCSACLPFVVIRDDVDPKQSKNGSKGAKIIAGHFMVRGNPMYKARR